MTIHRPVATRNATTSKATMARTFGVMAAPAAQRAWHGLLGLVLATTLLLPVSQVAAMQEEVVIARPPTPSQTAEPPIITTYLLLAVLVAAGIAVQALPSKRGHQD
jgi:hypothetical protein